MSTTSTSSNIPSAAAADSLRGLSALQLNMGVQCNVRCTMCFQTDFSTRFNMPPEIYRERLKDAYPHLKLVKIVGGEPTIMKNCREAATLLRDYPAIKLNVTTNGVNFDEFWQETILAQGVLVNFSINAATEASYDKIVILGRYKQVMDNIKRLAARRSGRTPTIAISSVILKDNVLEIAQLIQLAADTGVDMVEFLIDPILSFAGLPPAAMVIAECSRARELQARTGVRVDGLERFESHFDKSSAKQRWCTDMCSAPFEHLVVDWKGDVRVCANTWVKLGNLNNSSLLEIWTGKRLREYRENVQRSNYLWCAPNCDANPDPKRLALMHKYAYQIQEDPRQFTRKVKQKILQIRGKWVTVKNKKKDPAPVSLEKKTSPLVQIQQPPSDGAGSKSIH